MSVLPHIENGCTLPGCTAANVLLPGSMGGTTITINCTYDPLQRLSYACAEWDGAACQGASYRYTYDAVGNRLVNVDGVDYTWDNNGNLLNDGVNDYAYDSANRLSTFTGLSTTAAYSYNGLDDRLQKPWTSKPPNPH